MQLRDYQIKVIKEVYAYIKKGHKRILLVAPTGAGKTVMASQMMSDISRQNKRILFLVDRDSLVSQTAKALKKFGLTCGFIKAGYEENRQALIQVASVQTLKNREWWKSHTFDYIFIDECHELAFHKIVKNTMEVFQPNATYIGLTATPYRLNSKENIGDIFEIMTTCPVPGKLIEAGFLCEPIYYSLNIPDLKGVRTKNGDYLESDLAIRCDVPELIKKTVAEWKRLVSGKRTVAFCVNVEHAKHLCEAFRFEKIPAVVVTGETSTEERNKYFADLALGRLLVIVSVNIASKGLDVPCLEVALMCRPTKSRALYEQQIGRVLRLSPETDKRNAWILDQAGNVKRFGFIENKFRYILNSTDTDKEEMPPPMKECPKEAGGCGALLYGFEMVCKNCGYEFVKKEKEVINAKLVLQFRNESEKRDYELYRKYLREAFENRQSPGYALIRFQNGNKTKFPKKDWGYGAVFGEIDKNSDVCAIRYYKHLQLVAKVKNKPESWVKRYMTIEFGSNWQSVLVENLTRENYRREIEPIRIETKRNA